jgi:indolepyruvate ferredoxin oxidoreductase beta subunit
MSLVRAGRQIVVCGLGGQGILFVSRILAQGAMFDGLEVLTAETHGMSQRGGAVEAHLKMGEFYSSLVRRGSADAVLVLDPSRIEAALTLLGPDGICFANSKDAPIGVRAVDATAESRAMDYALGQNLVLLGFAAAGAPGAFPSQEGLLAALDQVPIEAAREPNRKAFERGVALAAQGT